MSKTKRKCIFVGVEYNFEPKEIYFIVDTPIAGVLKREKIPALGKTVKITRYRSRYCTGWYDLDTFNSYPCDISKELNIKHRGIQCPTCFRKSAFNPAFYNVPKRKISKKQLRYNLSPHIVYLACFGNNLFKIGISHKDRYKTRMLEQGARAGIIIEIKEDAYKARNLEKKISSTKIVKEIVHSKTKRKLIASEVVDLKRIREEYDEVKYLLNQQNSIIIDTPLHIPVKVNTHSG